MINLGKWQVKANLVFFSRSYVKIKIMADKNNYQNPYILFKEGHIKCRIFFTKLKLFAFLSLGTNLLHSIIVNIKKELL